MFWQKKAKDPICGMNVDPKTSLRKEVNGKTYYFCSERCANTFTSQIAPHSSSTSMQSSAHSHAQHDEHGCGCS